LVQLSARKAGELEDSKPRLIARITAWVRLFASSFSKILLRWFRTVFSLMPRRWPICLFDSPSATPS